MLAAPGKGIKLSMNWSTKPILVEVDCVEALSLLVEKGDTQHQLVHNVREIKWLIVLS
jgi:hypothetical protein